MSKHMAEATPAPLDPSKVKAGDFVEAVVTPVGHAPEYIVRGQAWASSAGALFVGPIELDSPRVSLLAHQPAPEPEPKWEPGTTGTATLNNLVSGNGAYDMRVMRVEWDGLHGFATQTGRIVEDGSTIWSIADFVPDESVDPEVVVDGTFFRLSEVPAYAERLNEALREVSQREKRAAIEREGKELIRSTRLDRDEVANAMHDDYLPSGGPRLGRTARRVLADAVLAHLRSEAR